MMKKAAYGKSMKAKAGTKKVKKAGYGKTMKAKAGLKKPKPSQKGLKKLPTVVRNKMGYAKKGKKVVKKAQAGGVAGKSKKAPMVDPKGAWTKVQERTIAGKKYKKAKAGCKTRKK